MLSNFFTSPLIRMTNGLSGPVLGLGLALSATAGCQLDRRPIYSDGGMGGDGGMTVTDGGGGTGGDGGMGGDGGVGGDGGMGGLIMGSQYAPSPLRPADSAILPPLNAFYLWGSGSVPAGRTVENYEFCRTAGAAGEIDGIDLCPASALLPEVFNVLDPLPATTTQRWKVRARYTGGYYSEWSSVLVFSSDNSIVGNWLLNGDANDGSTAGHDGALLGGASFAAGLFGEALSLDGVDGSMAVNDTGDHDFASGDFTLAAWIRPARDGVAEALITKRSMTNGYELYRASDGQLAFYGNGCGIAATGGSLPMGAWHRVAVVRSAGMVFLYVDDAMIGSGSCSDNFSNSADLTLGCSGADLGCAEPFQGLIDEASVRDQDSSAAVILNSYCADQARLNPSGPLPAACQ